METTRQLRLAIEIRNRDISELLDLLEETCKRLGEANGKGLKWAQAEYMAITYPLIERMGKTYPAINTPQQDENTPQLVEGV